MKRRVEKVWIPPEPVTDAVNQNLAAYSSVERQLLFNRGITDPESAEKFLNAQEEVHDPFLLKDMETAVERVCQAISERQKVVVFGDYDVDGVTATVLLVQVINRLGGRAEHYIPDRFEEGYGFSEAAIQGVLALNPDLIITVDCGVRSIKEVDLMNAADVDVIITDHHQPLDEVPHACAIINPKQAGDDYPFKGLAGVGLAYKLAQAVANRFPYMGLIIEGWLDLVALGTIADMAPLRDENRALVRLGLDCINQNKRPGINALIAVSSIKPGKVRSDNIGFMLGPRLNAAGRLKTAENAYHLLKSETLEEAAPLALSLDSENRERQTITKEIQLAVEAYAESIDEEVKKSLIFYFDEKFNEGVVGLAASRLAESYYRPSIVGAIKGDLIRASCRSIPEINITSALDECADLLVKHGGHAMAAGLTIETRNAGTFYQRMVEIIQRELDGKEIQPKVFAGAEIDLLDLPPSLINFIARLEPTGMENPYPLLISQDVTVDRVRPIGKEGDHLRFNVKKAAGKKGLDFKEVTYNAVAFNFGHLADRLKDGDHVNILYAYEVNEFNGNSSLQLNVRDIHLRTSND
ncbi:MAG: single-stranded-DNA-specific exonuclease RecJ [Pelolinea sp.]|nr:single-stranded-DNA-specific exonuclease RecJ [Pelolinea sp.]